MFPVHQNLLNNWNKRKTGNNALEMKKYTTGGRERRNHYELKHEGKRHQRHGGTWLGSRPPGIGRWYCEE